MTTPSVKTTAPSTDKSGAIELTIRRESLSSELQRVNLLIVLLAFFLVVLAVLYAAPELISATLRGRMLAAIRPMAAVVALYLAYEIGVRVWLRSLLRRGRITPAAFRYANAFLEVSLPTIVLAVGTLILGALPMLAGSVPFIYFPFIVLAALNLDSRLCVFAGLVAGMEFLAVVFLMFDRSATASLVNIQTMSMLASPHQYIIKSLLFVVGGSIAGFVASQLRRQLARVIMTLDERDRAISIFGQHVSAEVAELLLRQPMDFAAQEGDVCVMFLDIRDFSRLANERSPSEVMDYLNTLFGSMIPIINEHHGIINKFLGDGFMAVFGAPIDDEKQCQHAVTAALEIMRHVDQLNAQGRIPPTRLGIGLHLGRVITGNVGATDRKEYTVIGDAVNLASRIEQATKQLAARLLVSEAVATAIAGDGFEPQDMGLVELKGQAQQARLFKLA